MADLTNELSHAFAGKQTGESMEFDAMKREADRLSRAGSLTPERLEGLIRRARVPNDRARAWANAQNFRLRPASEVASR